MDEKLIELVRKCEELCDMANKKYSDSPWKETLWGQIGEELEKNQVIVPSCFTARFGLIIIVVSVKF
jgi:hypothetical protein